MGFYSQNEEDFGVDMNALVEAFIYDDITHHFSEDAVHEFCAEGGVGEALLEEKVLQRKGTLVRLDKATDEKRRMVIAAINMARYRKDPLYAKLVKYQILRKQTRQKIVDKYGAKAARAAKVAQKEYVKSMRSVNLANNKTMEDMGLR